MLTRKRIYIEFGFCLLICFLYAPQIQYMKLSILSALGFAGILIIGCLLALAKQSWSKCLLIIGSAGILCVGLYFSLLRIQFILVNHGMDRAEPPSSPVAFLLGWMSITIIFLIPGIIFSFWNAQVLRPTKIEEPHT